MWYVLITQKIDFIVTLYVCDVFFNDIHPSYPPSNPTNPFLLPNESHFYSWVIIIY